MATQRELEIIAGVFEAARELRLKGRELNNLNSWHMFKQAVELEKEGFAMCDMANVRFELTRVK